MTNMQIIVNSAVEHGLYSEAEVEELFVAMGCLPLFTFAEWKKRGYSVKKGEKAKMMCYIWKMKREKTTVHQKSGDDVEVDEKNFYKVKAYFFMPDQVEKIEKKAA